MSEPLIVSVIRHYYPDWKPPRDTRSVWIKCLCPFHAEERPSASISFQVNAFKCHACGVKGNYLTVIMREEEVNYAKAKRIAEDISAGGDGEIPPEPVRQSSRRLFGESGPVVPVYQSGDGQVPTGVRGRSTPWT